MVVQFPKLMIVIACFGKKLSIFFRDFNFGQFQMVSGSFGVPILSIFSGFGFRLVSDQFQFRIGKDSRNFPSFAGHYFLMLLQTSGSQPSSINDITLFWTIFDSHPLHPSSRVLLLRPYYCLRKIIDPLPPLDRDVIYGRPLRSIFF